MLFKGKAWDKFQLLVKKFAGFFGILYKLDLIVIFFTSLLSFSLLFLVLCSKDHLFFLIDTTISLFQVCLFVLLFSPDQLSRFLLLVTLYWAETKLMVFYTSTWFYFYVIRKSSFLL